MVLIAFKFLGQFGIGRLVRVEWSGASGKFFWGERVMAVLAEGPALGFETPPEAADAPPALKPGGGALVGVLVVEER